MAELILTQEEKDCGTVLDWSDETLGKAVRYGCTILEAKSHEEILTTLNGMSAIMVLIHSMLKSNGSELELTVNGLTRSGEELGDFKFTMERVK